MDFIEPLESRCLLSHSPIMPPVAPQAALPAVRAAPKAIPNMIGRFTGKIEVTELFFSHSFDTVLVVTSQKGHRITGTISIKHFGSKISYSGTISAKRHLEIKFNKRGFDGSASADVSANGRKISGDATIKQLISIDGDMELTKVGK